MAQAKKGNGVTNDSRVGWPLYPLRPSTGDGRCYCPVAVGGSSPGETYAVYERTPGGKVLGEYYWPTEDEQQAVACRYPNSPTVPWHLVHRDLLLAGVPVEELTNLPAPAVVALLVQRVDEALPTGVSMRIKEAYDLYQKAAASLGIPSPTDREAYDLLKTQELVQLSFPTFTNYLSKYRKATGTRKHTPRHGRTGRSTVKAKEGHRWR